LTKENYRLGLGIMSGTSTDGIDIALCQFSLTNDVKLLRFESAAYDNSWRQKLQNAQNLNGLDLLLFQNEFTRYTAHVVVKFLKDMSDQPDFIGAHGHTIFHQPKNGLTFQMFNGALMAAETGITTVCDFRSTDVAYGGQGAPLVPIGDQLLYAEYVACVNIGGIANVSFDMQGRRVAFDIGPANLILNLLAAREGKLYDENGRMASAGRMIPSLAEELNMLLYYELPPPKSLGREWIENTLIPLVEKYNFATSDLLHTLTNHIASQIGKSLSGLTNTGKVLVTGGGAHNGFLVERMRTYTDLEIVIPEKELIDAKEAIVFALLGKLRLEGKTNTLSCVTGSRKDHSGGAVYLP